MDERFLRNEMLWGREGQRRLAAAHVILFGLGGVGSYAAECLARSGIGELTLVGLNNTHVVQPSGIHKNLNVITAGEIPPNPSELLNAKRMQALLELLSDKMDFIIIDLPPIDAVTDALIVSKLTDGMSFVVAVKGDVSLDGAFTAQDVNQVRLAAGGKITLDVLPMAIADITGDGIFTAQDVNQVRLISGGKISATW